MCGIVGYVGRMRAVNEVLIDGLRRLEYRGYDSAGVAVWDGSELKIRRAVGTLTNLDAAIRNEDLSGSIGLGHTRWATHGKPSVPNAHPHVAGDVTIIHNGIVENYREIRVELEAAGRTILSETDTELVAHLIDQQVSAGVDLLSATRSVAKRLVGSYALAVFSTRTPDHIVVAKNGGSPLIFGLGQGESFLASDIPAILPHTRQMLFLADGEFAVLSRDGVQLVDANGHLIERAPRTIQWDPVSAEKGGFDHFMQKEIFEQPRALRETLGTRLREDELDLDLDGIDLSPAAAKNIERVTLLACGTAYYAAMVGKYLIEQIAGIPCEVDLASEYRYRRPIVGANALVIPVSQSGETADTLAALREAKARGARVLAVCNTRDSAIARESHDVLYTIAGPEIGVASTKCFTAQFLALYLIALKLGISRKTLGGDELKQAFANLRSLPRIVEHTLALDAQIRTVAQRYFRATNFLFLGRGIMYPIALEGALKLKEISYIHAEGYAAGEMKHGPIALIDQNMPVFFVAPRDAVYSKIVSNVEEVKARKGRVIALVTEGDTEIAKLAEETFTLPKTHDLLTPILASVPLQLFSYYVAVLRGCNVDQPRNLAKSVTVE